MAIVLTGTKTVNNHVAPHLSATVMTAILATPVENLTVAQVKQLVDALKRIPGGTNPGATLGTIFI